MSAETQVYRPRPLEWRQTNTWGVERWEAQSVHGVYVVKQAGMGYWLLLCRSSAVEMDRHGRTADSLDAAKALADSDNLSRLLPALVPVESVGGLVEACQAAATTTDPHVGPGLKRVLWSALSAAEREGLVKGATT